MPRVLLIHWNREEAQKRAAQLDAAGYQVHPDHQPGPPLLRRLKDDPPAAVVLDLTRLPSHGMEIGLALRHAASTRNVPLVFVEGVPEKVERIRKLLPDAVYTTWSRMRSSLKGAISNPPACPVVPASALAGYAGTPLPKKLGIKAGSSVELVDAPVDFRHTLGELPDGVVLHKKPDGSGSLILWFVSSRQALERRIERMARDIGPRPMWIIWPKKSSGRAPKNISGQAGDLTQPIVRKTAMAAGLVDYKICAVDATWSGLLFRRRK